MKKINLLVSIILMFGLSYNQYVQAQCPNCTIVLPPGIPADTILVDSLPSAYKNGYYEKTMSYRLPYTTDPLAAVAPPGVTVPLGLSIDHFKVLSVTGLPPGLSWIGDRPSPMLYNEVAPNKRDGCITLCGVPGASGVFTVNINLEIRVAGFIFPSPPIPLKFEILPDTNARFVVDNEIGCAPLQVAINNLTPSNGNSGFSYFWDFGNGQTDTIENPDTVVYNFGIATDTTIAITQRVIIDTFPYLLNTVVVASDPGNSCNDDIGSPPLVIRGAPDMYMILIGNGDTINTDPNFSLIGNTQNNEYPRDTMVFPGPVKLVAGQSYTLEIWDDDNANFNSDDPCGNGPVTLSSALGAGTHTLTSGSMTIEVTISHYIDTINYVDSVTVKNCSVIGANYVEIVEPILEVFPNPTRDQVNVSFHLNGLGEEVDLVMRDILGRTIYTEVMENVAGQYNRTISLDGQSNGLYLLQLRVGDQLVTRKVVLQQ